VPMICDPSRTRDAPVSREVVGIYSRYGPGWSPTGRVPSDCSPKPSPSGTSTPARLTLHADRSTSMTSKPVAMLLADLGVTKSHSRPHCSNDNPFSESQLKKGLGRRRGLAVVPRGLGSGVVVLP